jgi:hypothetical protein
MLFILPGTYCVLFATSCCLAYQPPANSTFISEQTSHQQPASSTFLSEHISTSHQPPAKRTSIFWKPDWNLVLEVRGTNAKS